MPPEDEPLNPENIALDSINTAAVDTVSDEPDDCTTLEQYELLKKKAELDSYTSDTASRKEYAKKIFVLTCLWVGGIYVLLLFQGFGYNGFRLGDSVMLAAIGSTTANIIGVFLIVTRYFFPEKKS
jgi:hypothetical protein